MTSPPTSGASGAPVKSGRAQKEHLNIDLTGTLRWYAYTFSCVLFTCASLSGKLSL